MRNLNSSSTLQRLALTALASLIALLCVIALILSMTLLLPTNAAKAAGGLTVDIIAAYNLVVDSNVESPSSYAPSVATVIGRFCNTNDYPLTDVTGFIGDYNQGTPASSTPGIYPRRYTTDTIPVNFATQYPHLYNPGVSGDYYAFEHIGGRIGTADATRFVGTLAPGECKVQYWHFTYPRRGNPNNTGNAVWGRTNDTNDDLWLEFDIWSTASGGASDDKTWRMTMRNEISAMANKIEPNNGTWFNTNSDAIRPGDLITSNGILYRLGVVNQGFDNDGDFIYDYNAWLQPIGDPSFDPSCFRLIRTTGVLTVSRVEGLSDLIMPFTDTLYFMNITLQNNGVVGEVHYTFMALNGPCSTAVTPYQEVASGADNEKFNADYGGALPPIGSTTPEVLLDKSGNITVTPGSTITYRLDAHNTGTASAGLPLYGLPLMLSDTIPVSTTYLAGSIVSDTSTTVLYSTDGGATWTITEPVPASNVTNIQVWMNDPLGVDSHAVVTFSVQVNASFPPPGSSPLIHNCAGASFGNAAPFATDCADTFVQGSYSVGDRVWQDENRNSIQDTGEVSITNVLLSLYYDRNGDRVLDSNDVWLMTRTTNSTGYYTFTNLPAGNYVVLVNQNDPNLPLGYRPTTPITFATTLSSTHPAEPNADFGFGPSLALKKAMVNNPAYDHGLVYYDLTVKNLRPGGGEPVAGSGCRYTTWASAYDEANSLAGNRAWLNYPNLYSPSGPDGNYATASFKATSEEVAVTGFDLAPQAGTISKVEVIMPMRVVPTIQGWLHTHVVTNGVASITPYNTPAISLTDGLFVIDITNEKPLGSWTWSEFQGTYHGIQLQAYKSANPPGHLDVDAVGFRVTTNGPCTAQNPNDIMTVVPLTDTFDFSLLQFVSAQPPETEVNTTTGVITWTNIGPIYPGDSASVRVTFLAPGVSSATQITNTACVTGTTFTDGGLANNQCVTATGIITPAGSISGVVWSDAGTLGWPIESTDFGIPGVAVYLYACYTDDPETTGVLVSYANVVKNKTCEAQTATSRWVTMSFQLTDQNGGYLFSGLQDAYYYVKVVTTTLPNMLTTQTAEANFAANGSGFSCSSPPANNSCDSLWGNLAQTLQDNSNPVNNIFTPINNASHITDVNFGYTGLAMIYGTVWQDYNGGGSRQSTDSGLDNGAVGITVTLHDSGGAVIATTQTDASGYYSFSGLAAGTYTIIVDAGTLPSPSDSWTQTFDPDATCVPTPDSGCDDQHTVTISAGEISGSHDFGYHQASLTWIGDTVYYDWNANGYQDPGDEGIPTVTLRLYLDVAGTGVLNLNLDPLVMTTTTSITGYYEFTGLPAGKYIVVVGQTDPYFPPRAVQTADPDEGLVLCRVCDGQGAANTTSFPVTDTVDFGFLPFGRGAIGDTVWRDLNGDGIQAGPLEVGIPGILITLTSDLNNDGDYVPILTATTDADGHYLFTNLITLLPEGNYRVFVDSNDPNLPTDVFGNYYIPSTPISYTTAITYAGVDLNADFGFMPLGAIGDTVYYDSNGNAQQDWNEQGISGITVTLVNSSTIVVNGVTYPPRTYLLTTTTNANGTYLFTGLVSDTYTVTVGTSVVVNGNSLPLTADPDADGVPCPGGYGCDGLTVVSLRPGTVFLGADFGYQPTGVIGDYVWLDTNRDGLQTAGEPGIAGVVVTVTNGVVHTTTTDFDGYYSFANLPISTTYTIYTITLAIPANLTPTITSAYGIASGLGNAGILSGTTLVSATVFISSSGHVDSINDTSCITCDLNVDFGFVTNGSLFISGTVFYDAGGNTDGITDTFTGGDIVSPTVTVFLYDQNHHRVGQTTTDASGHYTFTNLTGSSYYTVSVYYFTQQFAGTSLTAAGDYEVQTYHTVYLPDLSNVTDVDFGFYSPTPTSVTLQRFTASPASGPSLALAYLWPAVLAVSLGGLVLTRRIKRQRIRRS